MIYYISIPHQSPSHLYEYYDREDFREKMFNKQFHDATFGETNYDNFGFDDAENYFGHDYRSFLRIETKKDYQDAKKYRGHQSNRVNSLLKLVDYRRLSGRK